MNDNIHNEKSDKFCILSITERHFMDETMPYSIEYGNFDYVNYKSECGKVYNYQKTIDWLVGKTCHKCGRIVVLADE